MRTPALLLFVGLLAGGVGAERIDGIAAIVGDEVILLSEVDQATAEMLSGARSQPLPPELVAQIRAQALQTLIDGRLIAEAGDRLGLKASDQEIDGAIEAIAAQEGLTVEQVYAAAARQGLAADVYRARLGEEITRVRVISSAVQSRVSVSDEEVRQLFERQYRSGKPGLHVRVRHILLAWPEGASEEQRHAIHARGAEIRDWAMEGQDFGRLAREYSAAPSAVDGGLTVFRQGEVSPELAPYVFGMKLQEISPPVQTRHGVNLIKVIERYDPSAVQLEDVEEPLRAELFEMKTETAFGPWIEELRENRYVEVVAPELK